MTKVRPQKMPALRQPRNAKRASDEKVDVCEVLVAELQARRVRLQELLALVFNEVERAPASPPVKRSPARTHSRRQPMVMRQIA